MVNIAEGVEEVKGGGECSAVMIAVESMGWVDHCVQTMLLFATMTRKAW